VLVVQLVAQWVVLSYMVRAEQAKLLGQSESALQAATQATPSAAQP
jgi:hypothetical protein